MDFVHKVRLPCVVDPPIRIKVKGKGIHHGEQGGHGEKQNTEKTQKESIEPVVCFFLIKGI